VLSLWGLFFLQSREQRVLSADFRAMAGDQVSAIEREVLANLEVLESLRAFYKAVPRVEPEQFESFTAPLLRQHRTIQALEWIPRVTYEEKDRYISRPRDKYPAFDITERQAQGVMIPAGERSEYFPVYYVASYKGNEKALDFDLASNPTRKKALDAARAVGRSIATAPITLVQEDARQFGFLVFSPVYDEAALGVPGEPPPLKGFVLGVFRAGDMIEKSLSYLADSALSIRIEDAGASSDNQILYDTREGAPHDQHAADEPAFGYRREIPVADRSWTVSFGITPEFAAGYDFMQSWFFLAAALLFSASASGYVGLSHIAKSGGPSRCGSARASCRPPRAWR
jgi:CHASE1-domain containing sensor protein